MPYPFPALAWRLILITLALLAASPVAANRFRPCLMEPLPTYESHLSANGRFEFVISIRPDMPDSRQGGMYLRPDPSRENLPPKNLPHLIWASKLGEWKTDMLVADDGEHLAIRHEVYAMDEVAITLYQRNRKLHAYSVRDLVTTKEGITMRSDPPMDYGSPACRGGRRPTMEWLKSWRFDDAKQALTIVTRTGDEIEIELQSGNIVRRDRTDGGWHWRSW